MSAEEKPKPSFINNVKSNWASMLTITAAISVVINFYWKADDFIITRTKEAIKKEISIYNKNVEKDRDSIIANINKKYFEPIELKVEEHDKKLNLNTFFINQTIQGLNAEYEHYLYHGVMFYRSKPNSNGYSMYWYIFERDHRWEIYQATYNATCDCFEYYDIVERKRKRIK